MDTPYERLDSDVKKDWQNHPVTQLYLRTLEGCRQQLASAMLLQCEAPINDASAYSLSIEGGQRIGLLFAIDLAGCLNG